jgi:hypothetical protein
MAIAAIPLTVFILGYTDIFITRLFPSEGVPWSAWNERSRVYRNLYKAVSQVNITLIPESYQLFFNVGILYLAYQGVNRRIETPPMYHRAVHLTTVFLESQLFVFTLTDFLVNIIGLKLSV